MAKRGKDVVSIVGKQEEEGAAEGKGGTERENREKEGKGESREPGDWGRESGGGLEGGRPLYLC